MVDYSTIIQAHRDLIDAYDRIIAASSSISDCVVDYVSMLRNRAIRSLADYQLRTLNRT